MDIMGDEGAHIAMHEYQHSQHGHESGHGEDTEEKMAA